VEALEDRWLLSSYTVTDLGTLPTDQTSAGRVTLNNASGVQVVGQNPSDHTYLWDAVHGAQDLGTVGRDAESAPLSINDSGQVVGLSYTETLKVDKHNGYSYYVDTSLHAFLATSAGGMQNIGNDDIASGINKSGEVVGTLNNNQQAALWSGGHWTGLGTLGGSSSDGFGINDYGQAVGMSYIAAPTGYIINHAFLWTPATPGSTKGAMTDLGALNNTLGFDTSIASAINAQGMVTGQTVISDSGWYHAFVWSPSTPNGTKGTMVDLGALDGVYSLGNSINSSGTVVGGSTDGTAGGHAVIWTKGPNGYTMADLNSLIPAGSGWVLTGASAINDNGDIVGDGVVNGQNHAFLLTPTTTTVLAHLTSSASMTSPAGWTIAQGGDQPMAPVFALPTSDSTIFGPTAVSVALPAPLPPAVAGATSPAAPFSPASLFVQSLTSNLPPAGDADFFPPAWASEAAADRFFANIDSEMFVENSALTPRN
jgi:probable HAF family extracellular repeat protein